MLVCEPDMPPPVPDAEAVRTEAALSTAAKVRIRSSGVIGCSDMVPVGKKRERKKKETLSTRKGNLEMKIEALSYPFWEAT